MYNILICDDEKDIVNALKIYLSDPSYTIFEAYDGAEALALVKNEDIHLVLTDIMMPVRDGISFVSELRKTSNIPVILLSAKSEDTDKILGLNIGAVAFVVKKNPLAVCRAGIGRKTVEKYEYSVTKSAFLTIGLDTSRDLWYTSSVPETTGAVFPRKSCRGVKTNTSFVLYVALSVLGNERVIFLGGEKSECPVKRF